MKINLNFLDHLCILIYPELAFVIQLSKALSFEAKSERQLDNGSSILAPDQSNNLGGISTRNIDEHSIGSENDKLEEEKGDILEMVASLSGGNKVNLADYRSQLPTRMSFIESIYDEKLSNFDWHLKLDQAKRYSLDWRVEYEANKIIFALGIDRTASNFRQGSDIFALGFSNYGQLNSSDFCLVWYDLSHKIHLQDARTNSNNKLELIDTTESACRLLKASKNHLKGLVVHHSLRKFENEDGGSVIGGDDDTSRVLKEKGSTIAEEEVDDAHIRIIFERPLDVCSSDNYYTIDNGTTHLVWFTMRGPLLTIDELNLSDYIRDSSLKSDQVFEHGMNRVQLIATKQASPTKLGSDFKKITNEHHAIAEFRVDNYRVPARETTYWCKLFKLNSRFESRRYHITKYEAAIDKGNEHVVHHMELFNCANLNSKQEVDLRNLYENKGGWSGDCNGLNRPKETEPCRRVILAWAMGAHPLEYPEQVGQSIGGHKYSPYVVLEIHYNNVESTPNLVDNSGLKFEYTSKLRPYDSGILEVGLEYTEKNSIPPNMITPIAGYCVSECTRAAISSLSHPPGSSDSISMLLKHRPKQKQQQLLERHRANNNIGETTTVTTTNGSSPNHSHKRQMKNDYDSSNNLEDGIYIFAAQMHTHLAGIASWTEHIREGKLLNELQRDNHYSPHFQEIRMLPKPIHIAPGDALIHYCLYDTTKRENITLGGYSTSDEMCVTYLHYYPKIDLEVCKSSVDTEALEAYFAYLAREEGQNTSFRLKETGKRPRISSNFGEKSEIDKKKNDTDEDHGSNHLTTQTDSGSTSTSPIEAKSISENYNSIEWSARRSRELIQFYSQAPLSVQCNRSNGQRFPGYWNGIPPSQLWTTEAESSETVPFNLRSTNPDTPMLVGYRGSSRFNRRHTHC